MNSCEQGKEGNKFVWVLLHTKERLRSTNLYTEVYKFNKNKEGQEKVFVQDIQGFKKGEDHPKNPLLARLDAIPSSTDRAKILNSVGLYSAQIQKVALTDKSGKSYFKVIFNPDGTVTEITQYDPSNVLGDKNASDNSMDEDEDESDNEEEGPSHLGKRRQTVQGSSDGIIKLILEQSQAEKNHLYSRVETLVNENLDWKVENANLKSQVQTLTALVEGLKQENIDIKAAQDSQVQKLELEVAFWMQKSESTTEYYQKEMSKVTTIMGNMKEDMTKLLLGRVIQITEVFNELFPGENRHEDEFKKFGKHLKIAFDKQNKDFPKDVEKLYMNGPMSSLGYHMRDWSFVKEHMKEYFKDDVRRDMNAKYCANNSYYNQRQ